MSKKQLFLYAFRKSIPVMLGFLFLGAAYGIVLQAGGLGWIWALYTSLAIYAGSMQFALLPLMAARAPLSTIVLMTLMVNSRHLFYGLSFVDVFKKMGARYPYMIFSLTDETYSVLCACRRDPEFSAMNHRACWYIALLHQLYWVTGSVAGALAGELLAFDTTGIDFSMTALFVVILTDQLRTGSRDTLFIAGVAIVMSLLFLLLLGAEHFLLPTLAATVLVLGGLQTIRKAG